MTTSVLPEHLCITYNDVWCYTGVWTDGCLVFSTGLDQRLRCWNLETSKQHCFLVELAHSVINVPEPAGLHVESFNR